MTIPQWLVDGFAVFGFICAWCVSAGAVGMFFSGWRFKKWRVNREIDKMFGHHQDVPIPTRTMSVGEW